MLINESVVDRDGQISFSALVRWLDDDIVEYVLKDRELYTHVIHTYMYTHIYVYVYVLIMCI